MGGGTARRWGTVATVGVLWAVAQGAGSAKAESLGTLVVQFDGGEIGFGADDAVGRTTPIDAMVGSFAAFGDDPERREALLQAVRADWAPFDIVVLSSPPPQGDYAMVMVGPTNPFGSQVKGIATLDCDDALSPRSLAFAFYSADDGVPANVAATTISQEAAHGLGLEHVDGPGDIMLPVQAEGDSRFLDQCLPISGLPECGAQHQLECGSTEQQNSHAELMRRFGPSEPDHAAPSAEITFPSDGHEITFGEPLSVTVDAGDDQGLAEATLYVDGVGSSTDPDAPYGWEVNELPEGDYELYVAVSDLGGNVTMTEVIDVRVLPGDGVPSEDDDDDDGGFPGGTVPAPPPAPPPSQTSGCTMIGSAGMPAWWLLAVPLFGVGRRRRRSIGRVMPRGAANVV